MKQVFDFLMALFGLIILAPLFACLAIWIKLDSKGPLFFKQTRVGKNGKPFKIHKFRSMKVDSESKGKLTVGSDDLRITNSGKFIRKYKLDELPQLIDVLRGKMSLVGPRPEVPEFIAKYPKDVRDKVLSVKPGITDNASILLVDENKLLSNFDDPEIGYIQRILPIKQRLYVKYINERSFLGDVCLIFKTVVKIIR